MWRRRALPPSVLAGVLFALLLVPGGAHASGSTANSTSSSPGGCSAHYQPVADCSVPNGGKIDPCSLATGGTVSCAFNLPDLNPADWLSWLSCAVVADAQAIWNAIFSFFAQALVDLVNAVGGFFSSAISGIEGILAAPFTFVENLVSSAISSVTDSISGVAAATGPFAPIVTAGLVVVLVLAGLLLAWFVWVGAIAIGKTLFNLL